MTHSSANFGSMPANWQARFEAKAPLIQIDKAGVIVHGMLTHDAITKNRLQKPTHYIVAPWSQGRFSDGLQKYYLLAKGSVDAGEESLQAAMRESYEESGIHLQKLLTSGVVKPIPRNAFLSRHARIMIGASGNPNVSHIYHQAVEPIDNLIPHLKNSTSQAEHYAENGVTHFSRAVAPESVATYGALGLPDFETMMGWLRAGKIPKLTCENDGKIKSVTLGNPEKFCTIEKKMMRQIIDERKKQLADSSEPLWPWRAVDDDTPCIQTPKEFSMVYDALSGEQKKFVKHRLRAIKEALTYAGMVQGDSADKKIDTKIRPLGLYQEGADLLTVSEYLSRMVEQALENSRYDANVTGFHNPTSFKHGINHHLVQGMLQKQIGMLVPIILPEDIDNSRVSEPMKTILHAMCNRSNMQAVPSR